MKFEISGYSNIKIQNNIFYDKSKDMIIDHKGNQHNDFKICKVAKSMDGYEYHNGNIKNFSVFKYSESAKCELSKVEDYNIWRNALAKILQYNPTKNKKYKKFSYMAGAFDYDSGPFLNLICFVDSNGYINHKLCSDIYNEFEKYTDYVNNMPEEQFGMDNDEFIETYQSLKSCFEKGKNYGLVQF